MLLIAPHIHMQDGTYHEDVGYGNGKGQSRPQGGQLTNWLSCDRTHTYDAVIEKAKKQACTDALKRALK